MCFLIAYNAGLPLDLRPANKRRRYKVTPTLTGWAKTWNQPCNSYHYDSLTEINLTGKWFKIIAGQASVIEIAQSSLHHTIFTQTVAYVSGKGSAMATD